ncbi:MAG: acyl carrier protein [Rikenellaceae bacterium]
MEEKVLEIINVIRASKGLVELESIAPSDSLRDNIGFTSFDLAELTVRIEDEFDLDIFEDGLVSTIGEIYAKLK